MHADSSPPDMHSMFVVLSPVLRAHTVPVHAPTRMLFVTLGERTENRETPGAADD